MSIYNSKREITIAFDLDSLSDYTDSHLVSLWHLGQANPAPIEDREAGNIAEHIGREIIRRWLERAPVALWNHQGCHANSQILTKHGHWPGPTHDQWVYGKSEDDASTVGDRAARLFAEGTKATS